MSESGAIEAGCGIRAVVVTHRSATTIGDCLRRLLAARGVAEIVVVDNGSDDDTIARLAPFVQNEARLGLQANPDNPGFAFACNQGAVGCVQPWLAFVNPDCLVETDTFECMLAHAAMIHIVGALGCALADANGVEDPASRRRDPSLRQILFAGGARGALHVANDGSALQRVDAISGALMLMPAAVFREVGGFDAGYRLHAEDLDLCRRVRAAGYEVAIANDVRVAHLRGVSSRSRPLWVEWQKHRGLWRYFRKFEAASTAPPMRALLWCALWVHYALVAAKQLFLQVPRGSRSGA